MAKPTHPLTPRERALLRIVAAAQRKRADRLVPAAGDEVAGAAWAFNEAAAYLEGLAAGHELLDLDDVEVGVVVP
jgi:hypothetical protein